MFNNTRVLLVSVLSGAMLLAGCATDEHGRSRPMTDTEKGALFGALGGAAIGAIASRKEKRTKGVLLGAVGGGIAGGAVGHYMDNQKKDFEKALAAERDSGAILVEKLANNSLRVTMTAQTSFDVDSATIKGGFHNSMDKIADIVNKYGKTTLDVIGHTDDTGSNQHNQALSERRAQAVAQYFLSRNIHKERLRMEGVGESQPRASNSNEQGRAQNRRVEIVIEPVIEQS